MRSMTGYGSGRSLPGAGPRFTVEVHSVNRRQSEMILHLPRDLVSLEPRVRDAVNKRIARGRLTVTVSCQGQGEEGAERAAGLDTGLARAYYQAMLALRQELGVGGEITIETVLRAPGVLRSSAAEPMVTPDEVWDHVAGALAGALDELIQMREREGSAMARDLQARLDELERLTREVRARQPLVGENYHRALRERLERVSVDLPIDEDRLAKELALFADRSDISEELTRLESHLKQYREILSKEEPVGRTLDFLAQEIGREFNTLGVKSNDLVVSQLVVAGKAELEKIREQVQNIE